MYNVKNNSLQHSWWPPGAVVVFFSWYVCRDIYDFTYLLTYLLKDWNKYLEIFNGKCPNSQRQSRHCWPAGHSENDWL